MTLTQYGIIMASGLEVARGVGRLFVKFRYVCSCQCVKQAINRSSLNHFSTFERITCRTENETGNYFVRTGNNVSRTGFFAQGICRSSLGTRYNTTDSTSTTAITQGNVQVDPYKLVEPELLSLCDNIKQTLKSSYAELEQIAHYHFDGKGKSFRPMVVMLTAIACNKHYNSSSSTLLPPQRQIAMIAEMIHTASLIHDDVIDGASMRRGRASVQEQWGQRKAILAGDFIISVASMLLAKIRNPDVVEVLSQVLEDLVRGEFMQLGSKENENERFSHYLKKTFKKTASLLANSCKAVAVLCQSSEEVMDIAYQFGRNIGLAFQLVDDLLDFISTEELMGKPAAADLKLGLATAPVLFAAQQYPELNAMIMRRFTKAGDVAKAWELVTKSDGIKQTRILAEQHCKEAVRLISRLTHSSERDALVIVTHKVLNRLK